MTCIGARSHLESLHPHDAVAYASEIKPKPGLMSKRLLKSAFAAELNVQSGWREKLARLGFQDVSHNLTFTGVCADH